MYDDSIQIKIRRKNIEEKYNTSQASIYVTMQDRLNQKKKKKEKYNTSQTNIKNKSKSKQKCCLTFPINNNEKCNIENNCYLIFNE